MRHGNLLESKKNVVTTELFYSESDTNIKSLDKSH